jgi:hypothetical protein
MSELKPTKHGGAREGSGRKAKPKPPATVGKDIAQQILAHIGEALNPHGDKCICILCRWRKLALANDQKLRYQVEDRLLSRVVGQPPQAVEHSGPDGGPIEHAVVLDL